VKKKGEHTFGTQSRTY